MPRIGILSDIHANAAALEAVYLRLFDQVEFYWLLGDLLGYGPEPQRTYELIRSIDPEWALPGNHDWYIVPCDFSEREGDGLLPGPIYTINADGSKVRVSGPREAAWDIALRHRAICSDDLLNTLASLPLTQQVGDNIFAAHAVYCPDAQTSLEKRLVYPDDFEPFYLEPSAPWHGAPAGLPILHLGGHTHIRALWEREAGGTWAILPTQGHTPLKPDHVYHINPGSVGFSRDPLFACPTAAILDTDVWSIEFIEVPYDVEPVRQQMCKLDYPVELHNETEFPRCPV
jgi:predicted phosphodiesterase